MRQRSVLIESVLGGGGEVGALMRAFDWSTTSLGPLDQWPQSLRVCVRIMLDSSYPMGIGWGQDLTNLYNDASRLLHGTKHPAALGRPMREVFPETWETIGPIYERVLTHGQAYATPTDQLFPMNRHGYLEECYFRLSFSPIPDDSGQVGGVFVTGIDTTDRVIEDRRLQSLRDLASRTPGARDQAACWRISADTLGEHRETIPFSFPYAYCPNTQRASLVGPGIAPEVLDPLEIDCTKQNPWGLDTALATEGIVVELGPRASLLPATSWPIGPDRAVVLPIRLHEEGDTAGFLVLGIHPGRAFDEGYRKFVHRIAEQIAIGLANARAHEQERQRSDSLTEVDRAKTAFFNNVSHEFRTPLQLMLGPLEDVLKEADDRLSPADRQQLVTVRGNAQRLLKLVNTLLDFSRLQARSMKPVCEPTDLARLTTDLGSMFRSAMDSAGLRFLVDCHALEEPVFVDRGMWEMVVLNLLSNAFKFTFEGGVALSLNPVDGAVELQVRDTGVGIPEDQHEAVFERFRRIERAYARTHEGTGIGLPLVRELVELHGGSVKVESVVGSGSTFTVTIPLGKAHLPAEFIRTEHGVPRNQVRAEAYVEEALRWLPSASGAPPDAVIHAKPPLCDSSPQPGGSTERERIVLAEDSADMRQYLIRLLGDRYVVHAVADGEQALESVRELRPDLVLADVMMPRRDGFGLLRAIRDDPALCSTPVILVSARAGEDSIVEGLQADADDYLVKPFSSRELLARVAMHVKMAHLRRVTVERDQLLKENLVLRDEVNRTSMFEEIVGASPALRQVLTRVAKVAPTESTVLITGETGTGKELVARAIHRRSARASQAFVSVNCAAIPRDLIASELFGHEQGAFTGATQRRLGRFELAQGGTIFLDEVGELPIETQVALLRVLQERELERIGGSVSIPVDVRVIAATNRDLEAAIGAGTLRRDLFYRLNVFPIAVPALRERADDIPILVEYFIHRYARKAGKTIRRLNKRTLQHLRSYPWPGNVRELQNVIERSVIVCDTEEFTVDPSWLSGRSAIGGALALPGSRAAHERATIEDALRASRGRVFGPSGAAERLGVPRSTLESRIRALKINKTRFRAGPTKD